MSYQKIVPHLWFDDEAVEAANFYAGLFPGSVVHYTNVLEGTPSGGAEQVDFEIMGYQFMAISAGPGVTKNPSISFMVLFTREERKAFEKIWETLAGEGKVLMPFGKYDFSDLYGWLEDGYGVSWQFYMADEEPGSRVIPTMMFINANLGKAGEAMKFYMDIFRDAGMEDIHYYPGNDGPDSGQHVMHGQARLENLSFAFMDSAEDHAFDFSEGVSLIVKCDDQDEIDYYWNRLSHVPEAEVCGWLKDKYGVSWQIIPKVMDEMVENGSREQLQRVTEAFLKMKKFDVAELEAAYRN
ncbi:VOC family protein [Lacicoccus alkaliphilus]|uniref:Glyoxalase superfamily enzyme, possibly 3-demethylubiquinone-9 3-methyltransferase n=1 Tax=Lacicoccus alkaliphilus DSM 16010 TaxID=1123231 RepID=A0A1M7GGD3_9BACL|nr:VOC family protein [Salinicoccus alkaliphilus]SHM14929.1 Glyoxalase superfamily enzyme, possibly 3-demethylubiquinone-9 3-methyltransferase [Salinicoccus alkaliphilus DSM 16010]